MNLKHAIRTALHNLMEPIPARPETREIASTLDGRDITRGYIDPNQLTLPTDRILQLRGGGNLDIYTDILSDAQVHSTYQQRRLALVAAEYEVIPGGDKRADKMAARFLEEQLESLNWDKISNLMHYGVFYGHAVAEMMWARDGAQVGIDAIKVRDRARFAYDGAGRLRLRTTDHPDGELLPDAKFWSFYTGADHDDEPYGLGLAHWNYWPVMFKKQGIKFWLIALDKYGSPTAMGTFPANATADEQQKLLYTLRAIQTDSGIIKPEGTDIGLLERSGTGTADHRELAKYMDGLIAKVNLGQTLTSEAQGGQYKAQVQQDVRRALTKSDADLLNGSFTAGPATWLTHWNYPGAAVPRVRRQTEDPEDLNTRAERDYKIFQIGFRPTIKTINDTYPGDWEPITGAPTPTSPPSPNGSGTGAGGGAQSKINLAEGVQDADLADAYADRLEAESAPLLDDLIAPIRKLVMTADSLQQVRDGIYDLYSELPSDQLAVLMAKALAAAELGGRTEVEEGR